MKIKDSRIKEILINEKQIKKGIDKAAKWINRKFKGKTPVLLGILKGCIPFYGCIIPKLKIDCETEFMAISSFKGDTVATSSPEIKLDIAIDVKDREIIILEDIVDTARSLSKIKTRLEENGAKAVTIVSLLNKPANRIVDLKPDYYCFEIPNKFIVGFGLDYKEQLRNLPFIGTLKPEFINKEK